MLGLALGDVVGETLSGEIVGFALGDVVGEILGLAVLKSGVENS